jgi:TDG/mug DNA glycosylase family protein
MPAQNLGLLQLSRLPSTSPANARLSFDDKCEIWRETIGSALRSCHPMPKIKQTLDGEARDAFYLCAGSTEQK